MKIKADFVTNSSSTSHVVYIPKNFNISPQDVRNYLETQYDDLDEDFEDTALFKQNAIIDSILTRFNDVKNGGSVYEADGFDPEDHAVYSFVSYICNKNGFKLISEDIGGGGGMSVIMGISLDKINEIESRFTK